MATDLIAELLKQLPELPGVYLMRNDRGTILYVGKAVNLRNRVKSYFVAPSRLTSKTQALVENIHDFEYFVVTSEQEALILELNLVKRYWPPYNVLLKDDKTFPYLKIKAKEAWPRITITRRLEDDGSHYFGPFASMNSLKQSLEVLKRLFPLRTCAEKIENFKMPRPCLKFDMGYCLAPCTGKVSRKEYDEVIKQLVQFLELSNGQMAGVGFNRIPGDFQRFRRKTLVPPCPKPVRSPEIRKTRLCADPGTRDQDQILRFIHPLSQTLNSLR
mgnify:CR=1 FL=1